MSRTLLLSSLLASLLVAPAVAAERPMAHPEHGHEPMRQDSNDREIDRGDDEEDVLASARRKDADAVETYFDLYRKLEWEPGEAYRIEGKTLDLPYGRLTLGGGWVIPVKPAEPSSKLVAEKGEDWLPEREYIFAVYVGDGSFQWEAPNPTERWALNDGFRQLNIDKNSDRDGLEVSVDGGALITLNGRWRALLEEGGTPGTPDKKTAKKAEKIWNQRGDLQGIGYARRQTRDAFEGEERGFLNLELQSKTYRGMPWVTYDYDPDEHEAVGLGVLKRYPLNRNVVSSVSLGAWVDPAVAEGKTDAELGRMATKWEVDATHYNQDMTVYRDDDEGAWGMQVEGTVDLVFNEPHKTLRLALMKWGETGSAFRVTVDSLMDDQGNRLEFLHHGGAGGEIIARLPKEYAAGEKLTLSYRYSGLFIATLNQERADVSLSDAQATDYSRITNFRVPNDYAWYPQVPGHVDSYTFDWVLRLPKPMVAATSGMLLSLEDDGKYNVHTIKEEVPVSFPAILFGRFAMRENNPDYDKGEIKIRVFVHPGFEKDAQSFMDEAQSIISYYSAVLGPYPYKELDLAQMPNWFGYAQAPAGLVQMTGEVYMSKTDLANLYGRTSSARDYFIPHEIAHEWWGHRAGWGSYRDQWISETFAEYSAALYIEERDRLKSGDPKDTSGYDMRSNEWKRTRRGHVQSRTSPLWLGGRHDHYQSTVYARGPLILDQLRKAFGREAVVKMMYTLNNYAHQHGGHAITDDFELVLEQVIPGQSFDEFLDSFIKLNAQIPE